MFKKFAETPLTLWIALAVVVALCVIFAALVKTRRKWNARMLASGALCVALSFVLSCIRLYRMPTGGSVTPGSMLPLMLFSVAYGAGPGLLAGLVYGVLQYLQGGWWLNVWQFLLDYILAFTVLGLAGIAHNKSEKWMYLSIPFAALMRALCAFLAGLMWVADTPVSELVIGNWQFSTPVTYSLVYNGAYLIPDTLICPARRTRCPWKCPRPSPCRPSRLRRKCRRWKKRKSPKSPPSLRASRAPRSLRTRVLKSTPASPAPKRPKSPRSKNSFHFFTAHCSRFIRLLFVWNLPPRATINAVKPQQ